MIQEYAASLAAQMGVNLTGVSITGGTTVENYDIYSLKLSSHNVTADALIFQDDIDDLQNGIYCDRLEVRIRVALSRLQMSLDQRKKAGFSMMK